MKTIDPTLTTAQKTGAGQALARVLMNDNGKLHPVQLFNNAPSGSNSDAVNTGAEFVRIRHIAGGANRLDVQRITAPATESQWTTWTAGLVAADVYSTIAIFWTGTYVVAVWQDVATKEIKYKRSADGGATFGAAAVAYASPGVFLSAIGGVSGGSAQSGLMLAYTGQLYWAAYNPGADAWAALNSAALTTTGITSVAAAYDSANTRHVVAFIPSGFVVWCTAPIAILTRSTAGVWGAGRIYFGIGGDTSSQGNLAMSQGKIGDYFWLAFSRIKNYGASVEKYWLTCSNDGVFWEDAFAVDVEAEARLAPLGSLAGLNWLANERRVFNSNTHGLDADTFDLFYYLLRHSDIGALTADATNLDNSFSADEPQNYMLVKPRRGYTVGGTDYLVQAGTFYLVGHRFLKADKVCRLMAVDALGLLEQWEADQTFRYDGETLKALVELVCAIGGVHTVTFDAAAVWADTIGVFTLNPGISGLAALRSVAQRANAECVVQEDGSIYFFVPTTSPASGYTYGNDAGEHNHWVGEFGRGIAPNFEAVFGIYDTSVGQQIGEDVADYAAQAQAGRKFADITNERRLLVTADATELALARLVLAKEFKRVGEVETPPNLALEPMDVVAFSNSVSQFAADAGAWRVEAFVEEFDGPRAARKFYQHLTLRGVAT